MTQKTAEQRAEERYPLADDEPDFDNVLRQRGYMTCIREHVEPLEAEVVRLRALVQVLVDALAKNEEFSIQQSLAFSAAKKHGIVPTNTTERK